MASNARLSTSIPAQKTSTARSVTSPVGSNTRSVGIFTTEAAPSTAVATSATASCVTSFEQDIANPTISPGFIVTNAPQNLSYVYSTIILQGITYNNQWTWCVDYTQNIYIGATYTASMVYTYEYVLANPAVATGIEQVGRLNQVAFLLNTIVIGTSVASPSSQVWWKQTYTGCSTITASDFQSAWWALLQKPGECDLSTNNSLCTDTLDTVNTCNVAYLWNLAFANVPDGSSYYVPINNCRHTVLYPLIVIPEPPGDQSTQVQIVAVDINSWGVIPKCSCSASSSTEQTTSLVHSTSSLPVTTTPVATCIAAFSNELLVLMGYLQFPAFTPYFEIGNPGQAYALAYGTIQIGPEIFDSKPVWCIDFSHSVNHIIYTDSPVYTFDYVVAHPSLVRNLEQPQRLNQIAFLINNVVIEETIAAESNQTFPGQMNQTCSTVTALDFQVAIWALIQDPGDFNKFLASASSIYGGSAVNVCNVAYLWNLAFTNVPNGSIYNLPTSNCSGEVYYPLIIIPEPPFNQTTQVLLLVADINEWGLSLDCSCLSS